ncbi:MAG: mannose-1-phosphate guanylyltransferase [Bacteroidaceae bacterium]|nr:mannose-1-phosphate guanylyltransferase [Bacteroidaceae bacterium]
MNNSNKYCVIMAGGIGSRFWPTSTLDVPKQFIDFFGGGKTLLQQTYERAAKLFPEGHIIVTTHRSFTHLVREQLPELDPQCILHEPAFKSTAPSMAYAAYFLRSINPQANMIVLPADQLVFGEDAYIAALDKALDYVATHPHLVTMGIRATYPETRYGYIQIDGTNGIEPGFEEFHKVRTFTEKPQEEFARLFVESGDFYWNTGLFAWNVNTIIETMHPLLPEMMESFDHVFAGERTRDERRADVYRIYESFPSISVDYAVIEKAPNMYLQAGNFGWTDVGRWEDVYREAGKDSQGNVAEGGTCEFYNSRDNLVIIPKDKIAIIKDLEGFLVNITNDVIVICPKDEDDIRNFRNTMMMKHGDKYM